MENSQNSFNLDDYVIDVEDFFSDYIIQSGNTQYYLI